MAESEKILRCNSENCSEEVNYICHCKIPSIYLCTTHHHSEDHHSTYLYESISESDKKRIIDLCKKCKNDCITLKSNLLKECQENVTKIMNAANQLANNIREVEILYDEVIAYVYQNNIIMHTGEMSLIEKIISNEIGNTKKNSAYWDIPKIKLDMNFSINENQFNFLQYFKDLNPCPILTFFKGSTKIVANVLINNGCNVDLYLLDSCTENLGANASYCYLPDGTLFSNGGHNGAATNFTYIINTSTRSISKKANSSYQKQCSGACYYQKFVYVFCGVDSAGNCFNRVEKYSLENNTWAKFTTFPANTGYISSLAFEDGIFITGGNIQNIFKLNFSNNSYEGISNALSTNHKFMIQGMDKIYIFDNGKMYEYYNKKLECKNQATLINSMHLYCCPMRNGEFTYYILSDMHVYRFSHISLITDKIKPVHV